MVGHKSDLYICVEGVSPKVAVAGRTVPQHLGTHFHKRVAPIILETSIYMSLPL